MRLEGEGGGVGDALGNVEVVEAEGCGHGGQEEDIVVVWVIDGLSY